MGSSFNIEKRIAAHKNDLANYTHHSYKLQADFNLTHNISDFVFEILENTN
ncbi:hypothetical protein [Enterocloster clostridioformis]|uniref:hypothetical protein n=1 Tax=Enterocloster clostridioformis TaxID=1531 RepID=UPI003A7F4979